MRVSKHLVYAACRLKTYVDLLHGEVVEDLWLPAMQTYFSVACERICKSNGTELCSPMLRLMLIMLRRRLAYCEEIPLCRWERLYALDVPVNPSMSE